MAQAGPRPPEVQIATNRPQRRLAAILAADVVGCSRGLMGRDENGTLTRLKTHWMQHPARRARPSPPASGPARRSIALPFQSRGASTHCQMIVKSLAASDVTPVRIATATASLPLPPVASQ